MKRRLFTQHPHCLLVLSLCATLACSSPGPSSETPLDLTDLSSTDIMDSSPDLSLSDAGNKDGIQDNDMELDLATEEIGKLDGQFDSLEDAGFEIKEEVWEEVQEDVPAPLDIDCQGSESFDYTCSSGDPDSCPGGMCLGGLCIGPVMDEDRWDDCSNGTCDPCEELLGNCPADCGGLPLMTGTKSWNNDTTITIWLHGFSNSNSDWDESIYGSTGGCGGILEDLETYGVDTPCGNTQAGALAPNQRVKVDYYGAIPDTSWLTPEDVDEIEAYPGQTGVNGLHRYALIVAKFMRHRLDISGATHINIACHSMGCLVARLIIEQNIENLAAEGRFVRWFTSAGVIAGARLARLYDNQTVQEIAELFGIGQSDFVHMNPDYVQDEVCWYDHKLRAGNNPLLENMIIHHVCATDPRIEEALGIALLDLNNPGDEPNDGIMYSMDEFFHTQDPDVAFHAADGSIVPASHSFYYVDHMNLPDTDAAGVLATATLFHSRKIDIRLKSLELKNDRESHVLFDGENGAPPAEIVVESEVRYNPYVQQTFGKNILIHQSLLEHRDPEMFTQQQGTTMAWDWPIYTAPVLDEMDSLSLEFKLLEVDWYPRMSVQEWIFDKDQQLLSFSGQVELVDHEFELESEYVRAVIEVNVVPLY